MRMWMLNPSILCRKHLLGEHLEIHYVAGYLRKNNPIIKRWTDKGFVQTKSIVSRHSELVKEMERRGYKHNSSLPEFKPVNMGKVDKARNLEDLMGRCEECRKRRGNETKKILCVIC